MRRLRRAVAFSVTVGRVAIDHDIKYPAAAFAYYAFVAQIPFLIFVLAVVGDRLAERIRVVTPAFLTPDAQQLVSEALLATSGRVWAALLAVGVLAWSGANIVSGFQTVIERVEDETDESLAVQLRGAVSILGSFGLVIGSILLTNLLFILVPTAHRLAVVEPLVLFGLLTIAFLPLYYAPSQVVMTPRDALPGALLAAAGWTILLTVISFYARNASTFALYGVLSGIIIILTSLYAAGGILMLGIVLNVVTADTAISESS